MNEALDFPLPPTTGPYVAGPPTSSPALVPGPPTSSPTLVPGPPTSSPAPVPVPAPTPSPGPVAGELSALREKVAELEQVVSLAKTRVETLGAEKREALERALHLQEQLEAAHRREAELRAQVASAETSPADGNESVVAELLSRVAALEAIVSPSRAA